MKTFDKDDTTILIGAILMRYEKAKELKESDFKRLCGVKKEAFTTMCEVVNEVLSRETRGRKSGLSVEDQGLPTLGYWREYRTMLHLGQDFGLHESNVSRLVRKVEDILIKCGKFSLPSKRRLLEETGLSYTIVDVGGNDSRATEKKQKRCYSGKKKRHTLKEQLIICEESREMIATFFGKGQNTRLQIV